MKTTLPVLALLIFASCGTQVEKDQNKTETTDNSKTVVSDPATKNQRAIAQLEAKSGSKLNGTVTFTENKGVVTIKADLKGLTEGTHAIHIHESGDCSAHDGKTAGGHWNPTNEDHGQWERPPFHRGDIGNIEINKDGSGSLTHETDLWCLGCGDALRDIVGKSIVIHKGADDFTSQPSGGAGDRMGCGQIVLQ